MKLLILTVCVLGGILMANFIQNVYSDEKAEVLYFDDITIRGVTEIKTTYADTSHFSPCGEFGFESLKEFDCSWELAFDNAGVYTGGKND